MALDRNDRRGNRGLPDHGPGRASRHGGSEEIYPSADSVRLRTHTPVRNPRKENSHLNGVNFPGFWTRSPRAFPFYLNVAGAPARPDRARLPPSNNHNRAEVFRFLRAFSPA